MFKLIFFVLLISFANCNETLKALFIVHRHGDRSPSQSFPNDPYKDSKNWPTGWGELNKDGMLRMYNVGRFIRKKYENFLNNTNIRDVYVRSTSYERCLESTQLLVNGIYKPEGEWVWDTNQSWLPVPVYTTPNLKDSLLNMFNDEEFCLNGYNHEDEVVKTDFNNQLNKNYGYLLDKLNENTIGKNLTNLFESWLVYDALKVENLTIKNFEFPEWATKELLVALETVYKEIYRVKNKSKRLQRLAMGVFLNEITQKINALINPKKSDFIDGDNEVRKLNIYSAHDTNIFNILDMLEIPFGDLIPPFSTSLIFELHQKKNPLDFKESSFIRIIYLNETLSSNYLDFKTYNLKMSSCQVNCTVKDFLYSFSNLLITEKEWEKECLFQTSNRELYIDTKSHGSFITVIAIESIIIILLAGFILKKKKKF